MTIEHAPSTNGHLKHADEVHSEPSPPARPNTAPEAATGDSSRPRAQRRRMPRDLRGIALSALVATGVVLALRRLDRRAAD
jgi:hypothetical protein